MFNFFRLCGWFIVKVIVGLGALTFVAILSLGVRSLKMDLNDLEE